MATARLLLQDGSFLLLQDSAKLLLQDDSGAAAVAGPYLERDSVRIIPLITADSGVTWKPRGT